MQANHVPHRVTGTRVPPLPYSARPHSPSTTRLHLVATPPTQERHLIELLPPVPARPLPRRLSPRRQPPAQRFVWLLMAAVAGAVIVGLVLLQARYGVDVTDVSR